MAWARAGEFWLLMLNWAGGTRLREFQHGKASKWVPVLKVHAFGPSPREAEAGGLGVQGYPPLYREFEAKLN